MVSTTLKQPPVVTPTKIRVPLHKRKGHHVSVRNMADLVSEHGAEGGRVVGRVEGIDPAEAASDEGEPMRRARRCRAR